MSMSIRKNFVLDKKVAHHLEELAKESQKSMTTVIQEMIEERYKTIMVKKRLKIFEEIDGSATGLLGNFSIQSVKSSKSV